MSVISTLVVKLTADTGSLRTALGKSEKDVSKWGKANKAATVGAAAGLTAFVGLAGKSINTYKDFGGAVNKLSGLMNVSTEDASRLVGQWKRYGVESTTGVTAVKILSKNIAAAKGGNKAAIDSFKTLGISVKDLGKMSAADVMMKARDSMSGMEDKTQRTATMLKVFGKAGTEMLGWVKQTPKDIAGVNKSLEKLNLVWGDKQLETYKDLGKAQAENKLVWMGFQMTLAQTLVPTLTSILGLFQKVLWAIQPIAPYLKYVAAGLAAFLIAGKLAATGNAIIGFAKTVKLAAAASKVAAAAQWIWNTAMSANPVAIVIIALVALGVALVVAYKKSATFRRIVQAVFHAVGGVVKTVVGAIVAAVKWCWDKMKAIWAGLSWLVGWFRRNWKLILVAITGPVGLAVAFIVKNWGAIKKATAAVWGWIVDKVKGAAKAVWSGLVWYAQKYRQVWGAVWGWVKDKASSAWSGILSTISGFINKIIKIINYLPGVNVGYVNLGGKASAGAGTQGRGGVNAYAQGVARVSRPTLALIGEDGPEAVLPLSKPGRMKTILSQLGLIPSTGMVARGQKPPTVAGFPAFAQGGIVGDIKGFFGNLWGGVKDAFGALKGLISGLKIPKLGLAGMAGFLPEILRRVWAAVKGKFQGEFGKRPQIVHNATEHVGMPYIWGSNSPSRGGFDCSGLVQHAYAQAGINIPRIQVYGGKVIPASQMQPADVLLYNPGAIQGGVRVPFGHYKMYAGKGQTVEAGSGGVHMAPYAAAAQVRSYLNGGWHGDGGSFLATRPTLFGAGERGPEVVNVTPVRGGSGTDPVVVNVYGNVYGVDDLLDEIEYAQGVRGTRRGALSPT